MHAVTSGVYLDEPYSNALIATAFREGYVGASAGGKSDYERNFLDRFSDSQRTAIALQYMVLYDRVLLYPHFDNFDVRKLLADGTVGLPDLGPLYETRQVWGWPDIESHGLLYPTLSVLRAEGYPVDSLELKEKLKQGLLDGYMEHIDGYYQAEAAIMVNGPSSEREKDLQRAKQALAARTPVWGALNRVSKIVKASELADGPAVWDCPIGADIRPGTEGERPELLVGGLMIRGLRTVRLRSFSDALELRRHPAIAEFRGEFKELLAGFSEGETDKFIIERRISRANRALELADIAGQVGTVLTILGVPALAWKPASTAVTLAGAVIWVGAWTVRKHFKWALLSSSAIPKDTRC